jgi:hypothetical protein
MAKLHTAMFAGIAILSLAGSAHAQAPENHAMSVALPNGSTAEIRYVGPVAPQVTVAMATPPDAGDGPFYECYDAFGYFGHYSPCFRHGGHRERDAAKRLVAPPPQSRVVGPQGMPPQFVVPEHAPRGSRYHYMLISTAPDGQICAQRTEWLSRGPGKEPQVTRTDTGDGCAAMAVPPPTVEATPSPAS